MDIQKNVDLASYTSFHTGGKAEMLVSCESPEQIQHCITQANSNSPIWLIGFGTNVLVSDKGLPGLTIVSRGGSITQEDNVLIADAGVWWDDLVTYSIKQSLWGLELMSGIPSSIGGAIVGNIAAYGQQVSDSLAWIQVFNKTNHELQTIDAKILKYDYRYCSIQDQPELVVLKAAFKLSPTATTELQYGSAIRIASEFGIETKTLADRRTIIMEARKRAGSLYVPEDSNKRFTAGSFFRNPLVDHELAEKIVSYDETGKAKKILMLMNKVHGGHSERVSAAHVLLAAGFSRGQQWGSVRLHPDHILKIENVGVATSKEIYDVAMMIIEKVKQQLGVTLVPEVRCLGDFS